MPEKIKKDPKDQTVDEWLTDYENWMVENQPDYLLSPVTQRPSNNVPTQAQAQTQTQTQTQTQASGSLMVYVDHRTTHQGRVVLEFESCDGISSAVLFFNVSLTGRTKSYRSGQRGQFNPPPRGEFVKFYLRVIGKAPTRWSTAHKSLRNALKGKHFRVTTEAFRGSDGKLYNKIVDIELAN